MRRLILALALAIPLAPAFVASTVPGQALAAGSMPKFVEEGDASGLDSVYAGEWQYMVGGGASSFDCNDDGYQDLFLAGGEAKAKLYVNESTHGGKLAFAPIESGAELDHVTGAYPIDVDADGHIDLVVLRVGENVLMKGLGGCKFERANEALGFVGGDGWSTAFSATWEKGNQWPTLAIGNYVNRYEETFPWGSCTDNWLHRPGKDGVGFAAPLPLKPSFCPLSMMFSDWNRSGTPSLRVSNDREYYKGGQEQMWHVDPGAEPKLYSQAEGWKYLRIWGMGIASADLDWDGYPEYFMTSMADNKLQTLANVPVASTVAGTGAGTGAAAEKPKPLYKDVAYAKGVTAHRPYTGGEWRPSTAWHTAFEDVNNDGLEDLFIAKGNVAKMEDFALRDPNNLLVQQPDGKFVEMGEMAGVGSFKTSRGASLADFNNDGLPDLVVVNRWEKAQIWRNVTPEPGHFVALRLKQDGGNRDGIGAFVEIRRGDKIERREITMGGGHVSGDLGWRHIGLGAEKAADIRVIWPQTPPEAEAKIAWQHLAADSFYIVERDKPAITWDPADPAR